MKSVQVRLTVAAVVFCAILGAAIWAMGVISRNRQPVNVTDRQSIAVPESDWQDTPPDTAAADSAMPPAQLPTLTIGGKKNPDVYLQSLDIKVEVTGNIAATRYTMVFKNKTGRVLEGVLTFPIPDERSVTHYALDINGRMRDAVPVEKAKGTQVFEEIEHRRVDPGLLERVEGNNFRTRIYPIPANRTRTISIGYEEELSLERGLMYYRLPMVYPDSLENFSLRAEVLNSGNKPIVPKSDDEISFDAAGESYVASLTRENYRPARALIFALPAPADIPQVLTQSAQGNNYFLASVAAPRMGVRKKIWNDDLAILWDVSLSGSQRNLRREIEMLDTIFTNKKDANIHLYFLNNKLVKKGEYKVSNGKWDKLKNALETAIYDGGTAFSQINVNNPTTSVTPYIEGNEILFFSDGLSTLSDANFLKDINNMKDVTANRPIHCIVSSAKADYSVMKFITGKTKGKFINANALSPERLRRELLYETPLFLGIECGDSVNVREVYPSIATPVQGNFSISGITDAKESKLTLLFGFGNTVENRITIPIDATGAATQGNIHKIWAQKKIAELDLDYEKNRAELTELGRQFGIVTRNTSLIVLESVYDYIQYVIEPPKSEPRLLASYWRISDGKGNILYGGGVKGPKVSRDDYNSSVADLMSGLTGSSGGSGLSGGVKGMAAQQGGQQGEQGGQPVRSPSGNIQPVITIKPIKKDNEYLKQLTGNNADDYQIYLKLRDDYANSPAYYFDMADWFYTRGDRETALSVLTSIADLELENASLYRLLGYKFKEYGEYALEKFVCKKVIEWRPMEPQSYRDYALALADNGEAQAALDSLYSVLSRPYSNNIRNRTRGIDDVVVTEINHLIAKNQGLKLSKMDRRQIDGLPVDIRVVINWNMDNTDIDLHVLDPTGEECNNHNRQTRIGGRKSRDITIGYGPEQFILKKAVNGKYRIFVNYYGDRQFTSAGPSTVMAEIYTKYAGENEHRQVVTLQMSKTKRRGDGKVEVAVFDF